ncbi:grasp-with-spasm system SPASM domain peptide maturase [Roseivirga sp. BDSF3-8]|uniref:grasp-with-spasm system SPASM domain peptide maturase n=1 Tax=Roseivirga sp. BDSF3-8 TaxID=3241598 RepID=UPI003531DEEF
MSKPKEVFRLYANCKVTEGARRSIVCDLWHSRYDFIPNMLAYLLKEHDGMSLEEIKAHYDHEHDDVIEEYYDFLLKNGYGFYTDEPHLFPALPEGYRHPGRISNAIIDMDRQSGHDYKSLFGQLEALGCKAVQIRAYDPCPPAEWVRIMDCLLDTHIQAVEILTPHMDNVPPSEWIKVVNTYPRIGSFAVHGSPEDEVKETPGQVPVAFIKQVISDDTHCGLVHPAFFSINIDGYTESREANNCLNGKISIDRQGQLCNCPSLPERYGHVSEVSLAEALAMQDFVRYDSITKDSVSVCSDCEFRYICSDCRAFTHEKDYGTEAPKKYGKPAKCTYDPYTATWQSDVS